jgi:hypothetical protein
MLVFDVIFQCFFALSVEEEEDTNE